MTQPDQQPQQPIQPTPPPQGRGALAASIVGGLLFIPMVGAMSLSEDPLWQRLCYAGFGMLVLAMGGFGMSMGIQASGAGERPAWVGTTATILGALVLVAMFGVGYKIL
jgi:hypothetical protein